MTPALLGLAAAFLAFVGGTMTAGEAGGRWWRVATGAAVGLTALALAWQHAPGHALNQDVLAEARMAGEPVNARVVIQRTGARRQVRQVPLRQPVDGSGLALLLMAAAGLGGAGLAARRQKDRATLAGAALPLAGSAFGLAALSAGGGSGQGAAGVRAFLGQFDLAAAHVVGFTAPEGLWRFETPGLVAVGVLAAAGLVAMVSAVRPMPPRWQHGWPTLGALGVLAALGWQLALVGGAPWRPGEVALAVAAVLLGAASLQSDAPRRAATLCAAALVLTALSAGA